LKKSSLEETGVKRKDKMPGEGIGLKKRGGEGLSAGKFWGKGRRSDVSHSIWEKRSGVSRGVRK